MEKSGKKMLASLAVVGTIAAIAVFNVANIGGESNGASFLAENDNTDQKVMLKFNQFISENNKNYLTKEEYNARLSLFKESY